MPETLLYFTELLALPVYDLKGRRLGRVKDAAVVPLIDASRVDRYLVAAGGAWLSVRFAQVASISLSGIRLNDEKVVPYHSDEYMLRIGRDLLDQQIIDVNGRKVVRVNDVTFEHREDAGQKYLAVLEVDVGIRSIVRRVLQRRCTGARGSARSAAHQPELHPLGILQHYRGRPAAPTASQYFKRQAGRHASG